MFCGVAHSPNSTTTGLPWRATKSMYASGLISRSKVLYQPESKGLPCSASVSTCVNDFSRCNHRANHDFPAPGKPHRTRRRAAPGVIWRPCFLAAALRAERLRAFSPRLRAFGPSSACFIAREIRWRGGHRRLYAALRKVANPLNRSGLSLRWRPHQSASTGS